MDEKKKIGQMLSQIINRDYKHDDTSRGQA